MNTDSEIVSRSVRTPAAFAELFERHADGVARFAARRVGSEAAQDIVSETFLVAFRRRKDFDASVDSARPWLLGIATRLIRSHRATEAKHWHAFVAAAGSADLQVPGADDSERLDAEAAVRELGPLIAGLNRRDRETLFLYAWGDLTQAEIAKSLGVPTGTVKSRLNRIRRILGADPNGAVVSVTPKRGREDDGRLEQTA